jgi:hypothetical protein
MPAVSLARRPILQNRDERDDANESLPRTTASGHLRPSGKGRNLTYWPVNFSKAPANALVNGGHNAV